jgi:hypothetical protein
MHEQKLVNSPEKMPELLYIEIPQDHRLRTQEAQDNRLKMFPE